MEWNSWPLTCIGFCSIRWSRIQIKDTALQIYILTFHRVPSALHQLPMSPEDSLSPNVDINASEYIGFLCFHVHDIEVPKAAWESKAELSKALGPLHSPKFLSVTPGSLFLGWQWQKGPRLLKGLRNSGAKVSNPSCKFFKEREWIIPLCPLLSTTEPGK